MKYENGSPLFKPANPRHRSQTPQQQGQRQCRARGRGATHIEHQALAAAEPEKKLSGARGGCATLWIGAETPFIQRLSAPVRAVCHFCQSAVKINGFYAGSTLGIQDPVRGKYGVGRLYTVFSAPGVFTLRKQRQRRCRFKITDPEKVFYTEGA